MGVREQKRLNTAVLLHGSPHLKLLQFLFCGSQKSNLDSRRACKQPDRVTQKFPSTAGNLAQSPIEGSPPVALQVAQATVSLSHVRARTGRPLGVENRAQPQASPCGICGGESNSGIAFCFRRHFSFHLTKLIVAFRNFVNAPKNTY